MVFAVNVIGNRAAKCDEPCSRRDGNEQAVRHDHLEKIAKRYPGFGPQLFFSDIEGDKAIEANHRDEAAAAVERAIVIGALQSDWQDSRTGMLSNKRREVLSKLRRGNALRSPNDAPP